MSGTLQLDNGRGTQIASQAYGSSPLIKGDTNADGNLDTYDIDAMRIAIQTNATESVFDIDENQTVDEHDFDVLVQDILHIQPGDTNYDGQVGFDDFLVLVQNFGQTEKGWTEGNFDGDQEVTFADFLALSAFFGAV